MLCNEKASMVVASIATQQLGLHCQDLLQNVAAVASVQASGKAHLAVLKQPTAVLKGSK